MPTQLDLDWVYGVSPLATFRMMTRLEHLTEKARQLEYQDYQVLELRERAGVFRMVTQRLAEDIAPGRRLFGGKPVLKEWQLWEQSNWDASRKGELTMELPSAQATVVGRVELIPAGSVGTQFAVSISVKARKGAEEITEALGKRLEDEHRFRVSWLARQVAYGL